MTASMRDNRRRGTQRMTGRSMRTALAQMPARARRRVARLVHERGHMEDTYGTVELTELGFDNPEYVHYQPSSWRHLDRALEGCEVGPGDVFLDLGCGKGRIVYLAAQRPFDRVVGVEIAPELLAVAQRNVDRNSARLACDVELVAADVVEYAVPDDVTYVYLYNPFVGDVFRAALGGLIASLDRRPRPMTLIYANPTMAEEIAACGRFELVREFAMHGGHGQRHDGDLAAAPVNELVHVYRAAAV